MTSGLAKRVGRIISGGVHAFMNALEGVAPEVVMQQAIREVDGALDEVRLELGKVIASKHLAGQRLLQQNEEHESLTEKVQLALNEGRRDLAEAGVARQLDIEAQVPVVEQTLREEGEREKELESYVLALQAKKREMEEEFDSFTRSQKQVKVSLAAGTDAYAGQPMGSAERKVAEASSAFNRALKRSGGQPLVSSEPSHHLAELDTLARNNRIQERLVALLGSGK